MPKTLVTGATGFIGSHLARLLAERGDELKITVREESPVEQLDGIDYEPVKCDLLDRRAARRAVNGVERVFHVAGLVSLRKRDEKRVFDVNVVATRTLLEECLRADVERVVFTSSVAAIGPAEPGGTADETQVFTAGHLGIPYVNSKHEAEVEALRLAAHGLPVVIVNPTFVYGRGDVHGGSTSLVRRFLMGRIPVYTDGALNVVDVNDVARGLLLADEKGEPGERYILGNRNYTWQRLFADLGRISGFEPPPLKLPPPLALRMVELIERGPGRAPVSAVEVRSASQWWTYRNTKAKRELGWTTSPHEDTIEDTVNWYMEREGERLQRGRRSQPFQYKLAARAVSTVEGAAGFLGRLR
ncbi:MAG TPA: SDR family NAD(P)-dependent oxidoreductase [Candidatus Dormibacteraeota bacterium]|nr:SDR family NAD(P)-dependent oxidoreductase [Candidatus Dormibacteraeota bacterium]